MSVHSKNLEKINIKEQYSKTVSFRKKKEILPADFNNYYDILKKLIEKSDITVKNK
jgi:hypothetical protein